MSQFAILWSGFVATLLSAAFFWVFHSLRWTAFSPSSVLGGIFLREPESPRAESLGFVMLLLLGSILLPLVYAFVMRQWTGITWPAGAVLGTVHGVIAAAALPQIGMISASIRRGLFPEPGPFGWAWGRITPLVVVVGHALYGGVLGAILAAFE